MALMLPSVSPQTGRLADVLRSCVLAAQGEPNPLALPRVSSAIVVMVDGLGVDNVRARAGHARALTATLGKKDVIETVFPATTAAALTSLATGVSPGEHGVLGYAVRDPETGQLRNMLSDWGSSVDPAAWQPLPTLFEQARAAGLGATAVGYRTYAGSGFSQAVLRGADYVAADALDERVRAALDAARKPGIVYLYVAELDQAAHRFGWESPQWLSALEELDAAWAQLLRALPTGSGVLLTADHGVLDVPAHAQLVVNERAPELAAELTLVGGDPRVLYLWGDWPDAAARERVAEAWQAALGDAVFAVSREQAQSAGLFGPLSAEFASRVGDVLLIARSQVALYDSRFSSLQSRKMIGQHGALSDAERRVPLIRAGAFAR